MPEPSTVADPSSEADTLMNDVNSPLEVPDVSTGGATCERSNLSPQLRLAIAFGVLFALKWSLPLLGISSTLQVLTLLVVATCFTWRFWWRCSVNRRGALLLIGSLWVAGIAKILLGEWR
jgi:hypothetical protein